MRRLTVLLFILLLVLCNLPVFAQTRGGYRPPPTYRPPVRPGVGAYSSGTRPSIPRITRPPRSLDPARRQPTTGRPSNPAGGGAATNRTTANRTVTAGGSSYKPPIPAPKSPTVVSARVAAKPKLDQLRASLRARLRSSTALSSNNGRLPNAATGGGGGAGKPPKLPGGGGGKGNEPPRRPLSVDDLIASSEITTETSVLIERKKAGGFNQASEDFNALKPSNVVDRGNGFRTGTLSDGRRISIRPIEKVKSTNTPTIQIDPPRGNSRKTGRPIKIRYYE
jgi:hypothetical protein